LPLLCSDHRLIRRALIVLIAGALVLGAAPSSAVWAVSGEIVKRGLLDCFPAGLSAKDGSAIICETSAVIRSGDDLVFAVDNHVPGRELTSVFALAGGRDGISGGAPHYLTGSAIRASGKLEALTVTPDQAILLAATAFDRIKPDSAKQDAYNMLLAWPAGPTGSNPPVQIVAASRRDGVTSSLAVRRGLSAALASDRFPNGPSYFKVEGLAALPDGRLLFGIRMVGDSKEAFEFTIRIVSVSYDVREGSVVLGEDFALAYNFDAAAVAALGAKDVGLSSLEYDRFNDRLFLLTSYEFEVTDSGRVSSLGGFLWTFSVADLDAGKPPTLVLRRDGQPMVFAHKPEGLAVIDKTHLFIVHDDDRKIVCEKTIEGEAGLCRQPHQAAYAVVRLDQDPD